MSEKIKMDKLLNFFKKTFKNFILFLSVYKLIFVEFNHGNFLLIFNQTVQKRYKKMLKKLNLIKDKENNLNLNDFEMINVNRKKGALGVGSFATVKLAKHKHS